jgi:NAD(P)-dependent dehydrogenase (short-subunit alcohol dehydrogenase family)
MSFLGLEGYHVFITGAAGGIGGQAVQEFISKSLNSLIRSLTASKIDPLEDGALWLPGATCDSTLSVVFWSAL